MALGWYSVLKLVPWTEVISNAPQIADAAKKLWGSVSKKAPGDVAGDSAPGPSIGAAPLTPEARMAELEARLQANEAAVAELHRQLVDSTALIDTLASQNALLIRRVEANRLLVRWLIGAVAVVGVVALVALFGK
ncbi:hypothetical protein QTH91_02890 [Variovorax dokdonensis]|uniref:Uncharacterized protein n=1 Tax=Variovorax dokdonensis TaxID=344883 RepID=A0ABT7N669_9BURK|nr:hypothetical protein [Variovorax dokdonensis]MDM0043416.1 hypothetical protein [Variovorax dokdonensis]